MRDGALEGTRDDEGTVDPVTLGVTEYDGINEIDGDADMDGSNDVEGTPESVGNTDIDGAAVGDEVGGTYHLHRPNCK